MLMWGPLKDTGKEGFSVRRQAEKQQPVYRLILFCVPNLVVASCKAPLLSCRQCPPRPRISCSSVMHEDIPWTETHLFCDFLLVDLLLFFFLMPEQRFYSKKTKTLTLFFSFCYMQLCILLFCFACPFFDSVIFLSVENSKNILVMSSFKRLFGFCLVPWLHVSGLTVFILGQSPEWYILGLSCRADVPV